MKGKAAFTPFLLQIMRFPLPPHQGLELSLVPPLHRKEGEHGLQIGTVACR